MNSHYTRKELKDLKDFAKALLKAKEYSITEQQLDALKKHAETIRDAAQAFYEDGGVNIKNFELAMAAWKETSAELGYLIKDIEGLETTAAAPELKPCPFCGGNAAPEVVITHSEGCGLARYKVFCFSCGASGTVTQNQEEAAYSWNRRADDEKV